MPGTGVTRESRRTPGRSIQPDLGAMALDAIYVLYNDPDPPKPSRRNGLLDDEAVAPVSTDTRRIDRLRAHVSRVAEDLTGTIDKVIELDVIIPSDARALTEAPEPANA